MCVLRTRRPLALPLQMHLLHWVQLQHATQGLISMWSYEDGVVSPVSHNCISSQSWIHRSWSRQPQCWGGAHGSPVSFKEYGATFLSLSDSRKDSFPFQPITASPYCGLSLTQGKRCWLHCEPADCCCVPCSQWVSSCLAPILRLRVASIWASSQVFLHYLLPTKRQKILVHTH